MEKADSDEKKNLFKKLLERVRQSSSNQKIHHYIDKKALHIPKQNHDPESPNRKMNRLGGDNSDLNSNYHSDYEMNESEDDINAEDESDSENSDEGSEDEGEEISQEENTQEYTIEKDSYETLTEESKEITNEFHKANTDSGITDINNAGKTSSLKKDLFKIKTKRIDPLDSSSED